MSLISSQFLPPPVLTSAKRMVVARTDLSNMSQVDQSHFIKADIINKSTASAVSSNYKKYGGEVSDLMKKWDDKNKAPK